MPRDPENTGDLITDHPFDPRTEEIGVEGADRNEGWMYIALPPNPYLCKTCGLAEAAHAEAKK